MQPFHNASLRVPIWSLAVFTMLASAFLLSAASKPAAPTDSVSSATEIQKMQQEIKELRGQLPSQAHAMADVAFDPAKPGSPAP